MKLAGYILIGSDWPVVSANPLDTLVAATESRIEGQGALNEELKLLDAIEGMTRWPAEQAGFDHVGALEAGYHADMIWINSSDFNDPNKWRESGVSKVWKSGSLIYDADK